MNNVQPLVATHNYSRRRLVGIDYIGLCLVACAATTITGCVALSPELQRETDALSIDLVAKKQEVEQAYADIKAGEIGTTEGLELIKKLTAEIADINKRVEEISARTGVSKWKVAGIALINLIILGAGGTQALRWKSGLVNVVRAIHKARQGKGSAEDVVAEVVALKSKTVNSAAKKMPSTKKKKKAA